jgi:phosphatidylglycerophosphate synthase
MIFGLVMAFCDIMDGEIAKLKNNTTPFGRLLDVMVDKYVEGFVGLAAGLSMPAVLFPSLVWGILSVWGSILISVVSNIGGIITDKKPVKLVGRGDRGILILIGLIGGMIRPVFFTYSVIIITVLSHITVIHMLIQYDLILKKEEMKKKVNKEVHEASISSSLEPEREIVPSGV